MGQAFPLFSSGNILRKEMLDSLEDYAFQFGELLYEGYSDGILSGCSLTTTGDTIFLNRGIICCSGKLYLIKKPLSVKYFPTDTTCVCKLRFADEIRTEDFIYREIDLKLEEGAEPQMGELEVCRFKLQPGARLRCDYVDFEDRCTEYDTLNTIYSPFSAERDSTLSPEITKAFARETLQNESIPEVDLSFCLSLLESSRAVSREALKEYIRYRLGVKKWNLQI